MDLCVKEMEEEGNEYEEIMATTIDIKNRKKKLCFIHYVLFIMFYVFMDNFPVAVFRLHGVHFGSFSV